MYANAAAIEVLLNKKADVARIMMEESLPGSENESRSSICNSDSDRDVVFGDDSRQH